MSGVSVAQAREVGYNETMKLLVSLVVNVLTLMIVTSILPGFVIADWWTALVAAVVIGVINTFIKPVLLLLTLPLTIVTLGIFALILNVALLLAAAALVPGFSIDGLLTALLASILISLVSSFLGSLAR
jgi:putative membrane protein